MSEKFELESDFSTPELDTLLDALDNWEARDVELLELIDRLKRFPDPPREENEEFYEGFINFKRHMLDQEGRAKRDKKMRREKATLIKAKIILINQRQTSSDIWDQALEENNETEKKSKEKGKKEE